MTRSRPVRRHAMRRLAAIAAPIALATTLATACADTVIQVESDSGEINVDGTFQTASTTTLPIVGSTTELLAEMSAAMSKLSAQIGDIGDEKSTLLRLDSVWNTARAEVESTRPDLVGAFDTTIDMATIAVERRRPADADKALQIFTNLVDRYTGEG